MEAQPLHRTTAQQAAERVGQVEPAIVDHCRRVWGVRLVAVFLIGSYATGRARPDSDVDLLVVLESSDLSRPHRTRAFGRLQTNPDMEIMPVVLTREELLRFPSFVLTLIDGHRVLFSRDNEAADLVDAVRGWVARHGITRVPHKGGYYWSGLPR